MRTEAEVSPKRPREDAAPSRADLQPRIYAAQIRIMFRAAIRSIFAGFVAACLLLAVLEYLYGIPNSAAIGWVILQFVAFFVREGIALLYLRAPEGKLDTRKWTRAFVVATAVAGLVWGGGAMWLLGPGDVERELLIILVILSVSAGAVLTLGSYFPAALALLIPLTSALSLWSLLRDDAFHYAFALLAYLYMLVIGLLAWYTNTNLVLSLRLRFRNSDLITELREQKERADAARETAESANVAKSRFLAAASHDLRQPVHALAMFVGALRERPLDAHSAQLVEQISGSVDAMDGLFASLLDISRLDAGIVIPNEQVFPIGPLIERVCGEFHVEAEKKGLHLVDCPTRAFVRSDPILLERILRNIISNAVRYTDRGRILVGCRRGPRLGILVVDTGRGIAEADLGRVFEEFYQVGNAERDRLLGLGLGLAIVKRISALINSDLEIHSKPGRGTCVKFFVQLARAPEPAQPPHASASQIATEQSLIFVIDDEAQIRDAMVSLLTTWGNQVVVADSGAHIFEYAAGLQRRPDLIICDYRLRDGENGIDLMNRLRTEYNEDIPGMLITGDTAPDRLAEANQSGILILHKPLTSAKLRAAIYSLKAHSRIDAEA